MDRNKKTILVVDDEEKVRDITKLILEHAGYNVLLASNGKEAINIFRNNFTLIACVLLDLTMPIMDGKECYIELRRIKPDIPIIVTSGFSKQEVAQKFAGTKVSDFLQKPYRINTLLEAINKVIGVK